MNVVDFMSEVSDSLKKEGFIKPILILERTSVTIKAKIEINTKIFLQLYFNEISHKTCYALVLENQRIWGIDFDKIIGWHEHPFDNPQNHLKTFIHTPSEAIQKMKEIVLKI